MAILPLQLARVSDLLSANLSDQSISSTQAQLATVENELSTGKTVNQPSDNPAAASMIIALQKTLDQQQSYTNNINSAQTQLSQAESSLTSVTTLLQQATSIASKDVGSTVTDQQRQADAQVINSIITQIQSQANTQSNGVYIFGGDKGNQTPYADADGGVQFSGTNNIIHVPVDPNVLTPTQVSGQSVFGGLSTRVLGSSSLTPKVTAQTQLSSLGGATNDGVTLGTIQLSTGSATGAVDLSQAQTLGDVVNDINSAAIGGITASLSTTGINLTAGASDDITVTDSTGSSTAADLGIATPSAGAGTGNPVDGSPLNPAVTLLTPLADLNGGAGVSSAGLIISNGITSQTIIPAAGGDVDSLLNSINSSGLGVTAQINSTGNGINVYNNTQGTTLTIAENGGTTAADLGIRTFSPTSQLSQLNNGQGVQTAAAGANDFTITAASGANFQTSIAGANTVQDVINDINAAATTAGVNVTASFAATGNGIVLTDGTTGSGTLSVQDINNSTAATDLGLTAPASGNTITGADVNGVQVSGIFTDLQSLAAALNNGDQSAITAAGAAISNDSTNVSTVNGVAGAQLQALQNQTDQLQTQNLATQQLLSNLQDTNETAAISQFQTLQTALQAALLTTAQSQQITLLNFLT